MTASAKAPRASRKGVGGRPSKFDPRFVEEARKLAQLGATDREVAEFFEVEERTLNRWKITQPEFCQALKTGKDAADDRVEQSLYRRAVGYSYDAVKIFMPAGATAPVYAPYVEHVPPDTTAGIFWLKNRRKDEWRDKQDVEHSGSVKVVEGGVSGLLAAVKGGGAPADAEGRG